MDRCYGIALVVICFLGVIDGTHGQLVCQPTETEIRSPNVDDYGMTTCVDWIAAPPDVTRLDFREECQRWLIQPSAPASVSTYYIYYCEEFPTYTRYRADICCPGEVTGVNCFTCTNYTDDYTCTYDGTVQACAPGQVCQTTTDFFGLYPSTTNRKTKGCADAATCQALDDDDVNTCLDYILDPLCTDCCSTAFCDETSPSYDYIDQLDTPCLSNPCYYGGTCNYDLPDWTYNCTCPVDYTGDRCEIEPPTPCQLNDCENGGVCSNIGDDDFQCYCRQGWGGKNCSEAYGLCPDNSFCMNGGTCIDHESFGFRCACPTGYVGSKCEIESLTCTIPIGLDQEAHTSYTSNMNCTDLVLSERQYGETDSNNMNNCLNHMQQPGKPEFTDNEDGNVDQLESSSLWYCEEAEDRVWYSEEYCCPTCYSLPCQNGAWCIQDSNDDSYICRCRYGWTGQQCQNRKNLCVINGDTHYTTYDDTVIHYQGNNNYVLSRSLPNAPDLEPFTVTGENSPTSCSPPSPPGVNATVPNKVTYLDYLEIDVLGAHVKLYKRPATLFTPAVLKVDLDGAPFIPSDGGETGIPGLRVFLAGIYIVLEADLNTTEPKPIMTVEFSGECIGTIDLPPEYSTFVEGMCGDFNGEASNDLTTSYGQNVTGYPNKYTLIGDSWEVNPPSDRKVMQDDYIAECPPDMEDEVHSNEYCGLILDTTGIFKTCVLDTEVNEAIDFENCHYDFCVYANGTAEERKYKACLGLEAFALKCESKGHIVDWRDTAGCPKVCGNTTDYDYLSPPCHATCEWWDAPEQCHLANREGCYCPIDMVIDENGVCQSAESCGCTDENGNHREIGESWISAGCGTNNTCVVCTECPRPVGKIISEPHNCYCLDSNDRIWLIGENGLSLDCNWNVTCGVCLECTPVVGAFEKIPHGCQPAETCVVFDGIGYCQNIVETTTGRWSSWSRWSVCVNAGHNEWIKYRTRRCVNPDVTSGEATCHGDYIEQRPCHKKTKATKLNKHNQV